MPSAISNPELEHLLNFIGYDRLDASVWFLGMWEINNRGKVFKKGLEPYTRLALVIADYTAMRISEILNIQWKDVNILIKLSTSPMQKEAAEGLCPSL